MLGFAPNPYFCSATTGLTMKQLRALYEKYKNYSLDLIMYGFFLLFILILVIFFGD